MRFERFSERYGYVKIDDAMQMEWMSNELKNLLWNCIDRFLNTECYGKDESKLFYTYIFEYWWKLPLDVLPAYVDIRNQHFRKIYMKNEWNEVYDTLDFIAFFCRECQWKTALHDFTTQVNGVLERERSGYRMIDGLITPITDENEIASIKEAIEENLLDTAKTHIQEALNMLSDREHPDYRNSIKESISAVEAVCRYITNESTLDKALPKLKNKGIIIPDMLEDGMKKIYYFTNGEAGIRHALMDESTNIDFEEAKYMLVICSAFVNYLKAKQGKPMPNNLPLNWCECKFEDVLDYEQPTRYIVSNTDYQEQGIAVLTAGKSFILGYTDEKDGIFDASKETVIIFDDFTTASKLVDFPFKVKSSAMKILHAKKDININFLYYLMQTIHYESDTHKRYWISEYAKQTLNLPPLAEQERIVEKIEELFSDIDNGIKDLKIAQAQIKQYRQSVLKSAFEGKLTDNWRQLHKCEKNMEIKEETGIYKIPHSWLWCKLTAIGTLNRGKSKHRPRNDKKLYGGKYPFIQTGDVKEANMYIHKYSQTYNDFGLSQSKLWNENTLCITIAANIAETAILKIKACFPDSIVGFVKNKYLYSEELVEYYFRTIKGKLEKYAPATAQKNINLSVLNDILFPLPTIPEQQQIVAEIEKRFAVADEMEKAVNDSLLQAEKLKQSILKQAFAGKLVPQNPNDEPAAVLLERIKAAKENSTKGKK